LFRAKKLPGRLPGANTVNCIGVLACRLPEPPLIVTVVVPRVAAPFAVRVRVLVPPALVGLKDASTPLGRPEAEKLTLPEKPFWGMTVMLSVAVLS
jgi:hypothetical protein